MRTYQRSLITIIIVAMMTPFFLSTSNSDPSPEGLRAHSVVSHAMGAIKGHTITNSYEAFIANYEKGVRNFEMDFTFTSDGHLVGRHDWSEGLNKLLGQDQQLKAQGIQGRLTYEQFMRTDVNGLYKPLAWEDVLNLLVKYPDIYIITDTKENKPEEYRRVMEAMVSTARQKDPSVLDRIVPQIYSQPMWDELQSIYPFKQVIYTLYETDDTDAEVLAFAKQHPSLAAVTMSGGRATSELVTGLNKMNIPSYVHTVNDVKQILKFKRMGVYGFYSDSLSTQDVDGANWITAYMQ
ncbi:glycerophosphoryl diester phosphodiesterase [Paenibacillus shirakamiensis]|uniref:Glycerophosphoryl diester phosphodiesterase n=1 Tax=Paenibacillus shirakamiensis TaxID=1265935 RepID=A0ABS4JKX6_9BACL|nr:phosphatidylinositol-specific phospholipase C/glycerophosphodiester phosphodiesterase family protein [Paenibacillus shirakamiensis]MBP2001736.1 glycerophosphoryl diester phosphodiesterase [Paenibacillus shirakamiensis]